VRGTWFFGSAVSRDRVDLASLFRWDRCAALRPWAPLAHWELRAGSVGAWVRRGSALLGAVGGPPVFSARELPGSAWRGCGLAHGPGGPAGGGGAGAPAPARPASRTSARLAGVGGPACCIAEGPGAAGLDGIRKLHKKMKFHGKAV
jgi:hypothetical protein